VVEEKQQRMLSDDVRMEGITWMFDGIQMGHAVSRYNKLTSFTSSNQTDVVRMHFGLKGDYRFTYKQLNKCYDLIGGHHNTMFSDGFDMVVENKTLEIETFGIQFPKEVFIAFTQNANDTLKRFCCAIAEGRSAMLTQKWGAVNPAIEQVIQQVMNCSYTGDLKKIFMLSKSLELLVLSAEACTFAEERREVYIKTKADKEKIIAVRDLINERVNCPPNLSEIAKAVGLNEYKLKRGFKEIFDTTVFGYLTDQRLNLAHQYLCDTDKTAAEIAFNLGYATPQHFNNAFKKKFGTTPYLVRNNP
jgi:AraC family transcriptional activator of pyochelin receptor